MANRKFEPTPELTDLLVKSGSLHKEEALAANHEFAKALELPLRQGVLSGNILDDIFEPVQLAQSATPEFPLDFLAPGTEKDFVAYTIPNHGYIPQKHVEGDYVMVPTYDIGASIDYLLKYARDARWARGRRRLRLDSHARRPARGGLPDRGPRLAPAVGHHRGLGPGSGRGGRGRARARPRASGRGQCHHVDHHPRRRARAGGPRRGVGAGGAGAARLVLVRPAARAAHVRQRHSQVPRRASRLQHQFDR